MEKIKRSKPVPMKQDDEISLSNIMESGQDEGERIEKVSKLFSIVQEKI